MKTALKASLPLLLVSLSFSAACGGDAKTKGKSSSSAAANDKSSAPAKTAAPSSSAAAAKPKPQKGPLPAGFSVAVPRLKDGDKVTEVGLHPSMVMSPTDDPMIAFIEREGESKPKLMFTRWDRESGTWKGPIVVDTLEDVWKFIPQLELARDASSGALAIVYKKAEHEAWLASSSDSGTTWKSEKLPSKEGNIAGPTVALAKGGTFVAFNDGSEVKVLSRFAATGDFKEEKAPGLPEAATSKEQGVSIKVDADGKPGVLYALAPDKAYNTQVAFFRPGDSEAVKVLDSNNIQNDDMHLSLAFAGSKPVAAIQLNRGGGDKSTVYVVTLDDKTWTPVNVQPDGGQGMDGYIQIAASSSAGVIVSPITGGNLDGTKCGEPKLIRTSDWKAFTTCSPDTDASQKLRAKFGVGAIDSKGKVYVALQNESEAVQPAGLLVWHD